MTAISLCLTVNEMEEAFARLVTDYRLTGPVRKPGRGRFAGTATVEYDEIEKPDELELRRKSDFAAKTALLPTREVLFAFDKNGEPREPDADSRPAVVFLRACDIHALKILDAIFLRQGGCADPYYRRRRERLHPFLIECALQCPSAALTRAPVRYRLLVGGRTGKRNPRLAGTCSGNC